MKKLTLVVLLVVAGCKVKQPVTQPPVENPPQMMPPQMMPPQMMPPAACHLAPPATPVSCSSAPARLDAPALADGFFKDVFNEAQLSGHYSRRVTFADVNGDRFPDFASVETGVTPGLQHLFLNTAGVDRRVFTEATDSSGIALGPTGAKQTALMETFADIDGDGDLDLFSGSYSQAPSGTKYVADTNLIYLNDGLGHFTVVQQSGVEQPWPLTTAAAAFVDYDLDGKLDLFVGNFEQVYPNFDAYPNDLYKGDGTGHFTLSTGITESAPVGDPTGMYPKPTYGVTSCDVNDDGWPDLLTSSYALGANDLWLNQGGGTFWLAPHLFGYDQDDQPNPQEPNYRQGGNTFSSTCGDYDNDGDIDVFNAATTHSDYPRNTADRSRILRNTGALGGFTFERPALADTGINRDLASNGANGDWGDEGDHGAAWVDLDNDGQLDLVIENSAYVNSHAWIYHQNPDHSFTDVTANSGVAAAVVNSNGISVDDYDRDGDLDVLMGSVNTGSGSAPGGVEQIHLYENQLDGKSGFLYLTLKGVRSNRHGIGARVTVTAGCLTQTREISGGKGTFGAQDPAYAHFGLGSEQRIDTIEIRWPTNPSHVQVLHDVAPNQFLEVTEDSDDLWCEGPVKKPGSN
ncbi:MAG: CRTAC1 family protein [Myxococcaceae bacterium]